HNLKKIEKTISDLDAIVLSHGHYDHTGGLMEVLKQINGEVPIYLHPHALNPKFSKQNEKLRSIGMPKPVLDEINNYTNLKISEKPHIIHPSIITTGQVERSTKFEKVPLRFHQELNGEMVHDDILDDQSLILKLNTGILIICGCGHSGIVNIVNQATKICKTDEISLIIGGFHLINANLDIIDATINELKKFKIGLIGPNHCTGLYPTMRLINEYFERFREMHVGDNILLGT
ncbi:MAG: MBL fold metallo-hydrolase, partial [Candidatus Helarchaeota archaeon]